MLHRYSLLILLAIGFFQLAFARRVAPSFESFEVSSENGSFVAVVHQSEDEWILTVYGERTEDPLWSCVYDYSGYPGGYLADDGRSFVSVELIYAAEGSLVQLYTEGRLVATLDAQALDLELEDLPPAICACSQVWYESCSWGEAPLIGLAWHGSNHNLEPVFMLVGEDGKLRQIDTETGIVSFVLVPHAGRG